MKAFRALVSAVILPIMVTAHAGPVGAAAPSPAQLERLIGSQAAPVQPVHCRRYLHTHRRCVLWQGGDCHRWVDYRHRCG